MNEKILLDNETIILYLNIFGTFMLKYALIIGIVAILQFIGYQYRVRLRRHVKNYVLNERKGKNLLQKVMKMIEEMGNSERLTSIFYLFTIIFAFTFHVVHISEQNLEIRYNDVSTVISIFLYMVSLISSASRLSLIRKFYIIFKT